MFQAVGAREPQIAAHEFANEILHCVTMVKVVEVIPGVFVMWGLWPSERK